MRGGALWPGLVANQEASCSGIFLIGRAGCEIDNKMYVGRDYVRGLDVGEKER
jgi:hypothetical protein